jgi:hypothetical protein
MNTYETVARQDLEIPQGDDFELPLQLLTEEEDGTETAYDLAGCSLEAKVRRTHSDAAALFSFTVTVTNEAEGEFLLSVPRATTSAIEMTESEELAYWDLELTDADDKVKKLMRGRVVLVAEYTK